MASARDCMQRLAEDAFFAAASPPPLAAPARHPSRLVLTSTPKAREITAAAHAFLGRLLMPWTRVDRRSRRSVRREQIRVVTEA